MRGPPPRQPSWLPPGLGPCLAGPLSVPSPGLPAGPTLRAAVWLWARSSPSLGCFLSVPWFRSLLPVPGLHLHSLLLHPHRGGGDSCRIRISLTGHLPDGETEAPTPPPGGSLTSGLIFAARCSALSLPPPVPLARGHLPNWVLDPRQLGQGSRPPVPVRRAPPTPRAPRPTRPYRGPRAWGRPLDTVRAALTWARAASGPHQGQRGPSAPAVSAHCPLRRLIAAWGRSFWELTNGIRSPGGRVPGAGP